MADELEALARAYDPAAFEPHRIESKSHVAALQWGARRKLAMDAAERAHAAGFRLPEPVTPETGTEWEYIMRSRRKSPRRTYDSPVTDEETARFMAADPFDGRVTRQILRRRKAGPWLPVEDVPPDEDPFYDNAPDSRSGF